ncbi:MAG TPA: hypothetical protein VFB06_37705 [Streptosporangiaceae bacterium]|nr:hypothetical protein [Streptosporangiaceae bacterium]
MADHLGVSEFMVRSMRPEVPGAMKSQVRTGKDGRTIDASNIVRRREQAAAAEAPAFWTPPVHFHD